MRSYEKLAQAKAAYNTPINRPKGTLEQQEAKRVKKKSTNWFSKGQNQQDLKYSTTLFVPPTPGSALARELRRAERENNQGRTWGVKIVERRGTTISNILCRSYPWATTTCQSSNCFPCTSAAPNKQPKVSCRAPGIAYRVDCLSCQATGSSSCYEGESGRNGYTRGLEHLEAIRTNSKSNPLSTHQAQFHRGKAPRFRMTILKTFRDSLSRQIEEAKRIEESAGTCTLTMNSRSEWRSTQLPQVGFTQGRVRPGQQPTFSQLGAGPRTRPTQPQVPQVPANNNPVLLVPQARVNGHSI